MCAKSLFGIGYRDCVALVRKTRGASNELDRWRLLREQISKYISIEQGDFDAGVVRARLHHYGGARHHFPRPGPRANPHRGLPGFQQFRHGKKQFPKRRVAERTHKNLSNRPRCCDNPSKALSLAKHRNPEYANTRSFL